MTDTDEIQAIRDRWANVSPSWEQDDRDNSVLHARTFREDGHTHEQRVLLRMETDDREYDPADAIAIAAAPTDIATLLGELDEYDRAWERHRRAYARAAERWQAAKPEERSRMWPDLADAVVWLMEQLVTAEKSVNLIEAERDYYRKLAAAMHARQFFYSIKLDEHASLKELNRLMDRAKKLDVIAEEARCLLVKEKEK